MLELSRKLRDETLLVPKVGKVQLMGTREREVWVEADPNKLRGFALSPGLLRAAVEAHGVNVPGGKITMGRKELLVRSVGEFKRPEDIGRVIVRATSDGRLVRVADVAGVIDTFELERTRSRLDGQPVISLSITKQNDGNSIAVTDEVKRVAGEFARRHGNIISVGFTQDSSEPIKDMISKLSLNAWLGFVVVLALLLLVLGLRNAALAAMGIPISFLAGFIFMSLTWSPLANTIVWGLGVGTLLTLFMIPAVYLVMVHDIPRLLGVGRVKG